SAAVELARGGAGPSLPELRVPRLVPHSSQDDESYRSDAGRTAAAARDPLTRLRARLLSDGIVDELVRADLQRALAAPEPDAARAHRWLYGGDPPLSGDAANGFAAAAGAGS
ncbi:MAG: thiamine pyrophosphate-dependent enzyme, partial [Acidimicrobiales bacterium]